MVEAQGQGPIPNTGASRATLCIPASSAMSKNNFSDADNTLTKKRNRLKPRTINNLMFLRSNRDICM
jgi:hypothetical protein